MDDNESAWAAYRQTRSERDRNNLILVYLPLVEKLAKRMKKRLPSFVEEEDLVSYGVFGLIESVTRYDPNLATRFETFATVRIQGAMIDGLRKMDWAPRSSRSKSRRMEEARSDLTGKMGREPSLAELAEKLGWSREELDTTLQESNATLVTLFLPYSEPEGGSATLADSVTTGFDEQNASLDVSTLKDTLTSAILSLLDRERVVLVLYYFEDLRFSEIGNLLGVSESRVSQLHTGAVEKIRAAMLNKT